MLSLVHQLSFLLVSRANPTSHSLLNPHLAEQVHRTTPTPPQRANDQHLDLSHTALQPFQTRLDMRNHGVLIRIRLQSRQFTIPARLLLCRKCQGTGSCTCKPRVETKRGYTTTRLGIFEEFKVVQGTSALPEATENVLPAALLLVAVGELDVGVGQRVGGLGELFEAENGHVGGSGGPFVMRDELAADSALSAYLTAGVRMQRG